MVTAPAAAGSDSYALPPSPAGASPSSSPTSFKSVYQSLPVAKSDSHDAVSSSPAISKELNSKSGKKSSQQGADDSLPATAAVSVATELTPQRAIAITASTVASAAQASANDLPSQRAITITPSTVASAAQPSANDPQAALLTQLNASDEASTPAQGIASTPGVEASSLIQATVTTQANVATHATVATQATVTTRAPQPAPLPTRVTNPDKSPSAAAGMSRSFNPQDLAGTRTSALIAPPLPGEPQAPPDIAAHDSAAHDSEQHAGIPTRASATGASAQPRVDSSVINKGLADSIVPRSENLAFSLRMRESDSLAHRPQAAPEPAPARSQAANLTKNEERPPSSSAEATAIRAQSPANIPGEFSAATANLVWSEAAAAPRMDARPEVQLSAPRESINSTAVAAMHEAQPVLPETPKAPTTGEILLQFGGKDQAAAIRVSDRAGNVNVSVHAADPDLRSSLRSNLGELASQLTHQGWKTDELKSGTVLTRGEPSQDSRQDGQRSLSQQQSFSNGDRQPHRDRRANSGRRLEEFEEQASGNSGKPGGTN
jgi:hypothetical protein